MKTWSDIIPYFLLYGIIILMVGTVVLATALLYKTVIAWATLSTLTIVGSFITAAVAYAYVSFIVFMGATL
jgi:hypothetical protein